jgi:hypothetical protein
VRHDSADSGQSELFTSLHDMGPNEIARNAIQGEGSGRDRHTRHYAKAPQSITYKKLWAALLTVPAVRLTDVNAMCARLRKSEALLFPDWQAGKRVPQDHYRVQRPGR